MRISTRTRYGCRALVELAIAYPDRVVSVKQVAASQNLSIKYLGQIMSSLKSAGLVKSVRGAGGGYELTRVPSEIRLSEAFAVLEGSPAPLECVEHHESCPMEPICPTRDTWVEIGKAVHSVLEGTTLQDLADRKKSKVAAAALTYYI